MSEHDSHQHAIIGSQNLASHANHYELSMMEKEQKQKSFADELKR